MALLNSYVGETRRSSLRSLMLCFLISIESWVTEAISLPTPTGPYHVGVMRHAIQHFNDKDVLAPNNISTAFLATIFYPTRQAPEGGPKPYLNPETAAFYESSNNYTTGVLASLTSTLQENAPFLDRHDSREVASFPTILFGPGGAGPPTEGSTILLSELASHGYTVVGLDHPFEQPFLRFPNGTGVFGIDIDFNNADIIDAIYQTRLVDNAAFLRRFPALVRELNAPFNVNLIGLLGYSLGGAATLGSMLEEHDKAFNLAAGLNLDGPLWGRTTDNSSAVDLHRPVLLLGEQDLIPPAWSTFARWQTGSYFRKILINGSLHHDFSDDAFWKTVEPGVDPSVGPIDGLRQINITNTVIKAFFDQMLLGHRQEELLFRPSTSWTELTYYYKNGSMVLS